MTSVYCLNLPLKVWLLVGGAPTSKQADMDRFNTQSP
jgi:hypothetical protein